MKAAILISILLLTISCSKNLYPPKVKLNPYFKSHV